MNKLLNRLLSRHISYMQVVAFALASFVGMTLTIAAVQFYGDISPVLNGDDGVFGNNYVVVTKKVYTNLSDLTGGGSTSSHSFSEGELDELRSQTFVDDVESFVSSDFNVRLNLEYQGARFGTEGFFEAVSDGVIDVKSEEWKWEEGSDDLPIILPRNYLNLYNFGFATSQGLPKISEQVIQMLTLQAIVGGGYSTHVYHAHVVGFSNRLNTILVPKDFLLWANGQYGNGTRSQAQRLIIKLKNPADKNIATYFEDNDYVMEQDNMDSSRLSWFLQVIIGAIFLIGGVVCGLAFYLLMLSVMLLLEKNQEQIRNLRCIGFSVGAISRPYIMLITMLTCIVLLLSVGVVFWLRGTWVKELSAIYSQIQGSTVLPTVIYIVCVILFVNLIFSLFIRLKIRKI